MTAATKRRKKPDTGETLMMHRLLSMRVHGPQAVLEAITAQVLAEDDALAPLEPDVAVAHVSEIRGRADALIERWEEEADDSYRYPPSLSPLLVESARAQTGLPELRAS